MKVLISGLFKEKEKSGMGTYQELIERTSFLIQDGKSGVAFQELKKLEEAGNKDALVVLGILYSCGIGVIKDTTLAEEYLKKAIEMGSGDAAWELGNIFYQNDFDMPIDKRRALECFEKGATLGNYECMGALAECYLNGKDVVQNISLGVDYAKKAANAGVPLGMLNLAICYDDGRGVNRDPYLACDWYKKYLNHEPNDIFAISRIALCLSDPYKIYHIEPTIEMLREAFDYAQRAAEGGDAESQLILAWFYEEGKVVRQDFDIAHEYAQMSADNGYEEADRHLKFFRKNIFGKYYIPGY